MFRQFMNIHSIPISGIDGLPFAAMPPPRAVDPQLPLFRKRAFAGVPVPMANGLATSMIYAIVPKILYKK